MTPAMPFCFPGRYCPGFDPELALQDAREDVGLITSYEGLLDLQSRVKFGLAVCPDSVRDSDSSDTASQANSAP
jgi:hypothetical protein